MKRESDESDSTAGEPPTKKVVAPESATQTENGTKVSGLLKDVADLQSTVGDEDSGLVNTVNNHQVYVIKHEDAIDDLESDVLDLQNTVGTTTSTGLQRRVAELEDKIWKQGRIDIIRYQNYGELTTTALDPTITWYIKYAVDFVNEEIWILLKDGHWQKQGTEWPVLLIGNCCSYEGTNFKFSLIPKGGISGGTTTTGVYITYLDQNGNVSACNIFTSSGGSTNLQFSYPPTKTLNQMLPSLLVLPIVLE